MDGKKVMISPLFTNYSEAGANCDNVVGGGY